MARAKKSKKSVEPTKLDDMNFQQLFKYLAGDLDFWEVWKIFIYGAAWEMAKSCGNKNEHLQEEYDHLFTRLNPNQIKAFGLMLSRMVEEFEKNPYQDFLGNQYEQLGLSDPKNKKQLFTPIEVSKLMGRLVYEEDKIEESIKKDGFATVNDDCIGSGSTIIGLVSSLAERGLNYQQDIMVIGADLSEIALLQCYIQLSLLGVPAVLKQGNSLTLEYNYRLYTPSFIFNPLWNFRALRGRVPLIDQQIIDECIVPTTKKLAGMGV